MRKKNAYGVYFIFKSMEQWPTFRISVPKYPTKDPNHRILAHQRRRGLSPAPARVADVAAVVVFSGLSGCSAFSGGSP